MVKTARRSQLTPLQPLPDELLQLDNKESRKQGKYYKRPPLYGEGCCSEHSVEEGDIDYHEIGDDGYANTPEHPLIGEGAEGERRVKY